MERVIERRLREGITSSGSQVGFMPASHTKVVGIYRDSKKDLYIVYINLEEAYDRVAREVLKDIPVA